MISLSTVNSTVRKYFKLLNIIFKNDLKKIEYQCFIIFMSVIQPISVTPAGFEPTTHSLEGCCSIQLSYGASYGLAKIGNLFYFDQFRIPAKSYSILISIMVLRFFEVIVNKIL
jgi:hypothetical protein